MEVEAAVDKLGAGTDLGCGQDARVISCGGFPCGGQGIAWSSARGSDLTGGEGGGQRIMQAVGGLQSLESGSRDPADEAVLGNSGLLMAGGGGKSIGSAADKRDWHVWSAMEVEAAVDTLGAGTDLGCG